MTLTNKRAALFILLALFVGFLFLPPIALRLKAFSMVINLLVPSGRWRPLELFSQTPAKEIKTVQSTSGRTLDIHIYQPKRKTTAAIIIYTPFIGGSDDMRLVNLAQTFARAGFIVATPFRKEEPLIVNTKDINDIITTALFLKNESGLKIERLGFFGISYGNGPTIAASVDPQIKDWVRFIISFGGFYDLGDTLRFVRTGEYSYQDISGKLEPHSYAKEILSKTIAHYNMTEEEFLKSEVLADLKEKLSPAKVVQLISADFFIVHSTDDQLIPYTESIRLSDSLRTRSGQPITMLSLTTAFEHGDYKPFTFENFRQHYMPSFVDFYKLLYVLLAKYTY